MEQSVGVRVSPSAYLNSFFLMMFTDFPEINGNFFRQSYDALNSLSGVFFFSPTINSI